MNFSKEEQAIVAMICSGQLTTVESFLTQFSNLTEEQVSSKSSSSYSFTIGKPELEFQVRVTPNSTVLASSEPSVILEQLKRFIAIWDRLEKIALIKSMQISRDVIIRKKWKLVYKKIGEERLEPEWGIINIISQYADKEIIPLPGLDEFVKRNYRTTEEYFQNRTRIISIVAIVLSVITALTAIISSVFNYLTFANYSTHRTVSIENVGEILNDTTKVLLLNPIPVKTDTQNAIKEK